jgi:nanoRNase/pAp phosphatase (c-di-AMP/oligoRNAs hydrolase)
MKNYNISDIKSLIDNSKSALIVVPVLSVDSIGSALALALLLKKFGRDAKVLSLQKPDQNYSKLSGLELIVDSYNPADLVVTVSYPLDQIDQVSYNDDGGKLNLVVKTKPGSTKIDSSQIFINNSSNGADLCFMLGDESALGDKISMVNSGNWVFISPTNIQKTWAKATIIDPDAPFSEIFTFLLPMLGLNLDQDSGKNLLIGLRVATQSFSVNVSPESFEAGAICLRATQPEPTAPTAPITPPINQTSNFIPSTPTI